MTLTARQLETAKPKEKLYKLFDSKEKRLAFGIFPTVTLAEAREMRKQAKKVLAAGGDLGDVKKEEKAI